MKRKINVYQYEHARIQYAAVPTVSVYRETLPVEDFYHQECCSLDGTMCIEKLTDIYMLLNQKRLDHLTLQSFSDYMSRQSQHDNQLSALRSRCSDSDLLSFCKSRYIQSPSELLSWSRYLESNFPVSSVNSVTDTSSGSISSNNGNDNSSGDSI